jgi:NAD(P)-dependent dehydrogenase (short-subunit alcohol dehydrogenase family)
MTLLDSFNVDANVAVIGASGGIGAAALRLLSADERVASIHAFSRNLEIEPLPKVSAGYIDFDTEASIEEAAAVTAKSGPLDLVFVTSGILWEGNGLLPEKAMREISMDNLARLFAVNAAGPALVAKHFLPQLRKGSKTVFAALSARVGSIGDNRLGGWYSYRASKAALNMLLRGLAIEHARLRPESVIAGLHPGTVDTDLSAPFTSRTPREKIFAPDQSARYLIGVMDQLGPEDSGQTFAWDGSRIEF